jgi:hypothetical protein
MTALTTLLPVPLLRYLFRDESPQHPLDVPDNEERVQIG